MIQQGLSDPELLAAIAAATATAPASTSEIAEAAGWKIQAGSVLRRLRWMATRGLVEAVRHEGERANRPYYWRLTAAGRSRLSEAQKGAEQ